MATPFDATTKHLVEMEPGDWIEYAGLPRAPVDVIDADLATVSSEADKVLRVRETEPWLLHLEFQSSYERDLGDRVLQYSVLLYRRHHLRVTSIIVLLRPEADGPAMTGAVQLYRPDGRCYLDFSYDVVRSWQKPVEEVLG